MNSLARLERTRGVLFLVTIGAALVWGAAGYLAVLILTALGDRFIVLSLETRRILLAVAPVLGLAGAALVLWRNRALRSRASVALWLEEQVPALRYSLVTLAERRFPASHAELDAAVSRVGWSRPLRRAALRRLAPPVAVCAVALVTLALLPSGSLSRVREPQPGDLLSRPAGNTSDPFHPLVVRVTPPAYSGMRSQVLEDPEDVTALTGSTLRLEGRGWSDDLRMPDTATPLWLSREGQRRLLVLVPLLDSAPRVGLDTPAGDAVRQSATGLITLTAGAADDFGLEQGWFEYIVSSGEGERYTFRSGVIGRRGLDSDSASFTARLSLDSLRLAPGNIIHLRAAARDRNNVSGPGIGYSDTRTIRIPRPGEGDSLAVDQALPAGADSSLLSQRMILLMTEALERRRPRLRRDTLVAESRRIAGDQAALRRRVADVIFLRLGGEGSMEEAGDTASADRLTPEALLEAAEQATAISGQPTDFAEDETPVVALNRPLLEAYNAMWSAGRELEVGAPGRALPYMRQALEAIQLARQAERIYLRGRTSTRPVDVARVRLAGKLADAEPASVPPGPATPRDHLVTRFNRALNLLPAAGAVDSLLLLRLDALESSPRFSAALERAVTALRAGDDATGLLVAARRLLAEPAPGHRGLVPWDLAP